MRRVADHGCRAAGGGGRAEYKTMHPTYTLIYLIIYRFDRHVTSIVAAVSTATVPTQ
jgi:hypothetical protein